MCLCVCQLSPVQTVRRRIKVPLMCEMSVLEGLWGKNTDKEGVAGGRVNAQAFSFPYMIRIQSPWMGCSQVLGGMVFCIKLSYRSFQISVGDIKATMGVCEARLHQVHRPCASEAIPSQTHGNVWYTPVNFDGIAPTAQGFWDWWWQASETPRGGLKDVT